MHANLNGEERGEIMRRMRLKYWGNQIIQKPSEFIKPLSAAHTVTKEVTTTMVECTSLSQQKSNVHVPPNAVSINEEMREKWGIEKKDTFLINYVDAEHLSEAFRQDLVDIGNNSSDQHVYGPRLIWEILDPHMQMFPNQLCNMLALEDIYIYIS